jgi:hypothetical protein
MKNIKEVLSKAKRSKIVKQAKKGHDFGKKGAGFKKVEEEAEKEYGNEETAKKVAGAAFWKQRAKASKK